MAASISAVAGSRTPGDPAPRLPYLAACAGCGCDSSAAEPDTSTAAAWAMKSERVVCDDENSADPVYMDTQQQQQQMVKCVKEISKRVRSVSCHAMRHFSTLRIPLTGYKRWLLLGGKCNG